MVTKQGIDKFDLAIGLILAKNHMVTKLRPATVIPIFRLILAKNHMVTKQAVDISCLTCCLILAKNHMVTKREDI